MRREDDAPEATADGGTRQGTLLAVVGPSGVGKDALIDFARMRLEDAPRLRFAKRVITRPASLGEDHDAMSEAAFAERTAAGGFALDWTAHGLRYALPIAVRHWVDTGSVVVANLSRAAIHESGVRFPGLVVVSVTADPATIAQRLFGRARESVEGQQERLLRRVDPVPFAGPVLEINNSGPLHEGGARLVEIITAIRRQGS